MNRESESRCARCQHFMDNPEEMEAELPGIQALGSMYGSTRGDSGFCRITDRFMHALDRCEDFVDLDQEPDPGT